MKAASSSRHHPYFDMATRSKDGRGSHDDATRADLSLSAAARDDTGTDPSTDNNCDSSKKVHVSEASEQDAKNVVRDAFQRNICDMQKSAGMMTAPAVKTKESGTTSLRRHNMAPRVVVAGVDEAIDKRTGSDADNQGQTEDRRRPAVDAKVIAARLQGFQDGYIAGVEEDDATRRRVVNDLQELRNGGVDLRDLRDLHQVDDPTGGGNEEVTWPPHRLRIMFGSQEYRIRIADMDSDDEEAEKEEGEAARQPPPTEAVADETNKADEQGDGDAMPEDGKAARSPPQAVADDDMLPGVMMRCGSMYCYFVAPNQPRRSDD